MKAFIATRIKTVLWTDKRAKLSQELLGGMKIIKSFTWEDPFLKRIAEYRKKEIRYTSPLASYTSRALIRAS